jgi:hypothetical protein
MQKQATQLRTTKAIKVGNYTTWTALTIANVHTHFPESNETQKGHMKCQQQGVRSTRVLETIMEEEEEEEPIMDLGTHTKAIPKITSQPKAGTPQISTPKKMRDIYIKINNASDTLHTDQTGHFPATSNTENKYIMMLVEVDSDCIDAEPVKNGSAGSMVKAYFALWNHLTATGIIKPTTHLLNSKASVELKAKIKKN